MKKWIVLLSLISFMIDQVTKALLDRFLELGQSINIIPSFFSITYVRNDGAAWSLLSGNQIFLIIISFLALIVIYFCFIKNKSLNLLETYSYGLLIGGIFGNLMDRMIKGYVIDFFDFTILNYHFPVFNIADICIVIGVILIMIGIWKGEQNGAVISNQRRKKN